MGDLAKKTTITAEGLANLIEQFKGRPNLEAFTASFLNQLQDIENAAFELITDRTIDTAEGVQLDGLGQIIGIARGGLDDDDYRARLRAQILINNSSGTVEELIGILVLLETSTIEIRQTPPAAMTITITELQNDPALISGIIRSARAGGVGTVLIYTLVPLSESFSFSDSPIPQVNPNQGFADVPQTTGGQFAGAEAS